MSCHLRDVDISGLYKQIYQPIPRKVFPGNIYVLSMTRNRCFREDRYESRVEASCDFRDACQQEMSVDDGGRRQMESQTRAGKSSLDASPQ